MANEATATRQASADGAPVHRLRDILVEEVSLVDRAANKRRFLVVKRSGEVPEAGKPVGSRSADQQAAAAARGGGKKKPKAKPDDAVDKARRRSAPGASGDEDEDDEDLEKARRSGPPWEKDDDVETDKADDDEEDDEDEVETDKAAGEDDRDGEDDEEGGRTTDKARPRAKAAGAAPAVRQDRRGRPTEKADGDDLVMSATVKNAVLRVLAQALERLMGVANRVKEADELDDETEAYVPEDVTGELEDIGELLEDVAERLPAAKAAPGKAGVAKAGARMAKERLDRFQKALALLADVLKELTDAKQPAEPTGGVAENKLQKRAGEPGLRDLVASVNELTKIVKRQEDELAGVRKTRATSNAIPVDGGRRPATPDVSWPLDMNRPISRDTVSKSVSFYDEP